MKIDKNNLTENDVETILGRLPKVGSPSDLNFRIRASIANNNSLGHGDPAGRSRRNFISTAAVASLALILAAFIVGYQFIPADHDQQNAGDTVAEISADPPIDRPDSGSSQIQQTQSNNAKPLSNSLITNTEIPSSRSVDQARSATMRREIKEVKETVPSDGSYVEAGTENNKLMPRGIDQNPRPVAQPSDMSVERRIGISQILSQLGVDTDQSMKINSIKANSIGESIGMKPGDKIVRVNGKAANPQTTVANGVSVNSISVERNGHLIDLSLGSPH